MTIEKQETMPAVNDGGEGGGLRFSRVGRLARNLPWAVFLLPLVSWGCGIGTEAEGATDEVARTRVINVEVVSVDRTPFTETIRLTGTVQASQDVTVSAEESGVVQEILVDKGSWVAADQPLFRLDSDLLQAQVDQARALSDMATETWERRKRLYENDQVGSELVYLEAKYSAEQAQANLRLLQARLKRTVIRAPIGGVLDSREIEVGTLVGSGTPVARIVATNPVKVTAGVPERYAADVELRSPASVTFDVLSQEAFEGRISYVGAVVNPQNRTFPIEIVIDNPGRVIKPEMVANVAVVRRTLENVVVIPQESVVRVEDGYVAFVVEGAEPDQKAVTRALELGPAQGNMVVVLNGLEAGDRLVVVGQESVADGDRVNVVSEG